MTHLIEECLACNAVLCTPTRVNVAKIASVRANGRGPESAQDAFESPNALRTCLDQLRDQA